MDTHVKSDFPPLQAAKNGAGKMVELLLDRGTHIYADDVLLGAAKRVTQKRSSCFWTVERTSTPTATVPSGVPQAYGHTEMVKLLLDHGVDIHADVNDALQQSAGRSYTETVGLFLDHGADIHADNDSSLRQATTSGYTTMFELHLDVERTSMSTTTSLSDGLQ